MKNKPIRKVAFTDKVKTYSETQFRARFSHLTDQEKAYYLTELGIATATSKEKKEPEKKATLKSESETTRKGDE